MISISTKPYCLDKSFYFKFCFFDVIKRQFFFSLIFLSIFCYGLFSKIKILIIIGILLEFIFLLFWVVQFFAVTYLPECSVFFQRNSFVFSNECITIKPMNSKNQMAQVKWDKIRRISKNGDNFILFLSRVQIFYIPKSIFRNDFEYMMFCSILKRFQ